MRGLLAVMITGLLTLGLLAMSSTARAQDPQLAHIVFFTLKDKSPEARAKLVAACQKYLSGHDGTLHFSAGTRAAEMDREVNDTEFDVALHVVFASKQAHDVYQVHPRHLQFIEENKNSWEKVRVFDSYIGASNPGD